MRSCKFAMALALAALLGACTSYKTPGAAVNIPALNDTRIERLLGAEPAPILPARVALVRVQAPGYSSATNSGYASGRFSVIAQRDSESDADVARIASLPLVDAVVCFNPLMLPPALGSIRDLRVIAAKLQADVLLVYTVDTVFRTRDGAANTLSDLTFGWLREEQLQVSSNTSGMLVDVRTGFVYGLLNSGAQAARREAMLRSSSREEIDQLRLQAEQEAYGQLVGALEQLWQELLQRSGAPAISNAPAAAPVRC